MIKHETAI